MFCASNILTSLGVYELSFKTVTDSKRINFIPTNHQIIKEPHDLSSADKIRSYLLLISDDKNE